MFERKTPENSTISQNIFLEPDLDDFFAVVWHFGGQMRMGLVFLTSKLFLKLLSSDCCFCTVLYYKMACSAAENCAAFTDSFLVRLILRITYFISSSL